MKITKNKLKQLIKEEIQNVLNEKYLVDQWPWDSTDPNRGRGPLEPSPEEDRAAAMAMTRAVDAQAQRDAAARVPGHDEEVERAREFDRAFRPEDKVEVRGPGHGRRRRAQYKSVGPDDAGGLAQELLDADFPGPYEGDALGLWDAYVQTAKEILMGHPAGMGHRGPVIKKAGYDPREDA